MATVKNVAELAGVNVSTVSRYLSGKLSVTPDTEHRILEAIKETGYKPNLIAQSLRSGSSNTIAVVAPDIFQPGISGTIRGIDRYLRGTDYVLLTAIAGAHASRELEVLENFRSLMVKGVIIIGQRFGNVNTNKKIKQTIGFDTPLVYISRSFSESDIPEVCPDQVNGVKLLTEYLLNKGYRKIGLIIGKLDHPDAIAKINGYKLGLKNCGMATDEKLIIEGLYHPESTRTATDYLLGKKVDAIIGTSDLMAISAIHHIQNKGLFVPQDVAVASYGGTLWSEIMVPTLTTVVVKLDELGHSAAEMLLAQINGTDSTHRFQMHPVELRIGGTT